MRHHLAILYADYLNKIVCGCKRIECRLGKMGYPPHGMVGQGDLIWLKEVRGPIRAVACAEAVRSFQPLTRDRLEWIRREFNDDIRAPDSFWLRAPEATAVTLVWLGHVCPLKPFRIAKRDRRAWVPLDGPPIPGRPIVAHTTAACLTHMVERSITLDISRFQERDCARGLDCH